MQLGSAHERKIAPTSSPKDLQNFESVARLAPPKSMLKQHLLLYIKHIGLTRLGTESGAADFYAPRMPPTPRSGGDRESFRGNSSKKIDFAHRSDVVARLGSRELRAVKIPASYDAWRPPKRRKNDSEKI